MKIKIVSITGLICFGAATVAIAQHDAHGPTPDQIGSASVHFEISCAPEVRQDFNSAIALLHSFWFTQAVDTFNTVLERDPECAMAHWGIAMSHWGNPFAGLRSPQQLVSGTAAIRQAQATGTPEAREKAYIAASAELFSDSQSATQGARTQAYAQAMERLVRQYPEDREAKIFHALAINQTAQPNDKSYARQLEAASILEPLFEADPSHPGIAHYIIHAYDHPPLAENGLQAARSYASLAPAIPHALHMPSHTFTRMGLWKESVETNRRSAEAARNNSAGSELHALDYQTYAYLQMARDEEASEVLERAMSLVEDIDGGAIGATGAGAFAIAAIPARYALERSAFSEAAALTVHPADTPFTMAITHFARALGAARSGNPEAAHDDINALAALRDQLEAAQDAYWTEQTDIQWRVARAWVAFAQGRREEGIRMLREATGIEEGTDKSAISPGPLAPARELLGMMLLEAGQPEQALEAFEATMSKEPNRFLSLYGAARAAENAGSQDKARRYYQQLLALADEAAPGRPELQHARTFMASGVADI